MLKLSKKKWQISDFLSLMVDLPIRRNKTPVQAK